jgi:hypothetical protein
MGLSRIAGTRLILLVPLVVAWACGNEPATPRPSPAAAIDAAVASPNLDASTNGADVTAPEVNCAPYQGLANCAVRTTPQATANASGLSWDDPVDLQTALDLASCGCEVWLAEGTYLPTRALESDDPRTRSFFLVAQAQVLGGFAGDETAAEQRDPAQHVTILSGDLGEPTLRDDNAYHVVVGAQEAVLDGLTIRDGQADGFNDGQLVGGGLLNIDASVTLRSVHVIDNAAVTGAGIFNDPTSHPQLQDCVIARNVADTGGGLYMGGTSNAHVTRTVFLENVAIFIGGGIAHGVGRLEVADSRFVSNRGDFGGAIAVSGGSALVERSWFEGNWAGLFGGAAIVRDGASASFASSVLFANSSVGHGANFVVWTATLQLSGVTVAGGHAAFGGILLTKDQSQIAINDSLLWANSDDDQELFRSEGLGNTLTIENSLVQANTGLGTPDAAGAESDPLLLNAPLRTRFTERAGSPTELRVADLSEFAVGDRLELGDDGVERTVTEVTDQRVVFEPALATNTARFLRIDSWPLTAPSLDADLHLDLTSPAIDRASDLAPLLDVYGQARSDIPGVGNDCQDAGCNAADLGGIETPP